MIIAANQRMKFPKRIIDRSIHKRLKTHGTLFDRAIKSKKWVGAHVSAAGGPANAVVNASLIGATSFALFTSSQRKWDGKPFTDDQILEFNGKLDEYGYTHILPHGSYLVNLGNPYQEMRKKSYNAFVQDLKRCEALGIKLYNFHPGSCTSIGDKDESLKYIAHALNDAHAETDHVITVLENSAGQGWSLGTTFEELRAIIDSVTVKSRVGVCLDTCHLFAAGYDISTIKSFEKVMQEFNDIVGIEYLMALHLNDSKGELGCKKDRHENIGKGKIGMECFQYIMNNEKFNNMPIILETPLGPSQDLSIWEHEIDLLYSLIND